MGDWATRCAGNPSRMETPSRRPFVFCQSVSAGDSGGEPMLGSMDLGEDEGCPRAPCIAPELGYTGPMHRPDASWRPLAT